ncbi:tyrosine-type recombinase/integrase [Dyadobacter psychrotolerans]|uniref:Integrase n=1 Tax=Dyadobacter psychrotolerans TaxID=2541721 RepID=A0A4R5DY62_9BACT|nr:tyrosine-type recombinase/integrase [Dyadobacter psychrotolerans]TDE17131.1 integrase [Dyadobacter psychrotolerans]
MINNSIKYEIAVHSGKEVIFIRFDYNTELNERARKLTGAKWSNSQKAWYVADSHHYRQKFGLEPKPLAGKEVMAHISDVNQPALRLYIETLQLKAYSPSTIRTYINEFAQLLYIIKDKQVNNLEPEQLRNYFLYCINTLKLTENTIHSRMNAVKFFFEQVLKRPKVFIEIPRPKKRVILPNVLAISQIERLFCQLENLKHKTMLFLAYSGGLRVSEVVNLKIRDIHSERMVINIKGAKGKKDRTVVLSPGILDLLRKYYASYKPGDWLFEGQYKDERYSTRSLQQIFQRAKNKAKIIQPVTFHSLRHSYATHLHERGTDIKLIQELLGHNDIQTTMRYTHVSNLKIEKIESPFDQLHLKKE